MTVPASPHELTAEWLTAALRATDTITDARATSLRTRPVEDKGITSQIARVQVHYDAADPGAPRALVVKCSSADPRTRAMCHSMGIYEREVRFYQEIASQVSLRTPRCYFSALEPTAGLSLLILEDLGPERNSSTIQGCSPAEARVALRAIATLHAAWWQHPQLSEKEWLQLPDILSVREAPALFEQTWEPFLQKLGPASDEVLPIGAWLRKHLPRLITYLYEAEPRTLIHNDYQADNLFFTGADAALSAAVIDWQFTTRGRAVLDVAGFLGGNLNQIDRRRHELHLIRDYHSALVHNGVQDYSFERCWDDYRLAVVYPISRLSTVVGLGAAPPDQERGIREVLVPRFCSAVRDLNSSEVFERNF